MKQQFKEFIEQCLQDENAYCTAACPFHMDVRDFMEKMSRGAFGAAFKTYRDAVAFPRIAAALCGGRCRSVCPRAGTDAALNMELLEKAAICYAPSTAPNRYSLPRKPWRIAIVGAGPSGLACALRLASRRYEVAVFEKSGRIGGHLWDILPPEEFMPDIQEQFVYEKYDLHLNTDIKSLEELAGFDAVYVTTGTEGNNLGLSRNPDGAFASDKPGIFMGGSLAGADGVRTIADGLRAVYAIERYIKTGAMNQPPDNSRTLMRLDSAALIPALPVIPADGSFYTKEEAVLEAKRCIRCACNACVRQCDLMEFYKKSPKRICDEVAITIEPASLDGEETFAKRLIGTCDQCGICAEVCPKGIDMGAFLLESRRTMHKKGKLPWAFHDFWLRDMEHALSDEASLMLRPSGAEKPDYVFFPGCQLGASDLDYVSESYRYLLSVKPDTVLWLDCCGAPAVWSGDEALSAEIFNRLGSELEALGNPKPIFACPACKQMFERYMSSTGGVFLIDYMRQNGFIPERSMNGERWCVFDPCTSRHEPSLRESARELVKKAGANIESLPYEGKRAKCCGWGGHVSIANPGYARAVVQKRVGQSELPYITYCVNCRDIFTSEEKDCVHILDIMFDLNDKHRPSPDWSTRRKNRVKLRQSALAEFGSDTRTLNLNYGDERTNLRIGEDLRKKLSTSLILEEDVRAAVTRCEQSGRTVTDAAKGTLCGYAVIGRVTYWVEYKRISDNEYLLVNAYSHRMKIEIEETWNGRKTPDYM